MGWNFNPPPEKMDKAILILKMNLNFGKKLRKILPKLSGQELNLGLLLAFLILLGILKSVAFLQLS